MAQFAPSPSVYVGNLDPAVNEPILFDHFKPAGSIVSVRVCLDSQTQKSLCYGYINFQSVQDAENAIEKFGTSKLLSKFIRVSKVQRDSAARRSGKCNIIIKHLPKECDVPFVKDMFQKFGKIASVSVATDETNVSRGYAYVMFEKEESATKAVEETNGNEIGDATILVEHYRPQHRAEQLEKFTNLYVKNMAPDVTDERLTAFFKQHGDVTSAKVRNDPSGAPMGFGYVAFKTHEEAAHAVEAANDQENEICAPGQKIVVRRFQSRMERNRNRDRQRREKQAQFAKFPNLYVKNFDESVTSDQLKECFEKYGGPTVSVKVMFDPQTKVSRMFGFVSLRDQQTAMKCIAELNGSTFLSNRPLFVTYALKKDARRQALEEQHKKQLRRQPMVGPGGQYGGMGGAPNLMGGMANMFSMPNNMMQQPRAQMPLMQQNYMPRTGMMPNMMPNRMPTVGVPRPQPQLAPRPMPVQQVPQPQSLAAILASMNTEQQKNVLGERLYNVIIRDHPAEAAKVTGMLLEMDNGEILNLLDSPDQLNSKITEALEVLARHAGA